MTHNLRFEFYKSSLFNSLIEQSKLLYDYHYLIIEIQSIVSKFFQFLLIFSVIYFMCKNIGYQTLEMV